MATLKQPNAQVTDVAEVVASAQSGCLESFGELVRRFQRDIQGYLTRMIGDPHTAADLTQEAFLRAQSSLNTLREAQTFRPWLFRIATNHARNWLRHRARTPAGHLDVDATLDGPLEQTQDSSFHQPVPTPRDAAERGELARMIRSAIGQLPPIYREAVVLRFQHGMKVHEMADVWQISIAAAESRVRRAKELLRGEITQRMASGDSPEKTEGRPW